jgi:flagellar biosynthetic protein FliR
MDIQFPIAEVTRFTIVLTRLGGIMLIAPFFAGGYVPLPIRVALTLFIALAMTLAFPLGNIPLELGMGSITVILLLEFLFGLVIGFTGQCIFAGLQMAGQIMAFKMGFSMINLIDPQSSVNMPILSFLMNYIGLLLFIMINGHHFFLLAVHQSFTTLPVGGFTLPGPLVNQIVGFTANVFVIGVKVAGPLIVTLIIVDVIVGVIGRTAPQIHVMVLGMPLKILIGFFILSVSLYFLPRYLESLFLPLSRTLRALATVAG